MGRFLACLILGMCGTLAADEVIEGSQTIHGDLTVNGNLTVNGDLIVNGRIISTGEVAAPNPEEVFVALWRLDQQHNGMSVTLRGSDGRWQDEEADIRLDEQGISLNPDVDGAPNPLLVVHRPSKLSGPTYETVTALFDNYQADEASDEDPLGGNPTEDAEIDAFLNAVMATEVMTRARQFANRQNLRPDEGDYTADEFKKLLKHQWFELFTNHFSSPKPDCCGFEHVFVGDHNRAKIGGHHFWFKYFLDQEIGKADSLGHKYNGPRGERYRWIATFRMSWSPQSGLTLNKPDQKGFFVGCSPELMLAYGTLGLLLEKMQDGAHPVIGFDGGRYELTVHASTVAGAGDPDDRRGSQIRSVFPTLRAVTDSGPGLDLTVAEALATANGQRIQVKGIIMDAHNGEFGLQLADTLNGPQFLAVKLPSTFRTEFNAQRNPSAKGTTVIVHGRRGKYTGVDGLVDVTHVEPVE